MKWYGTILKVPSGTLAEELELQPGDKILEINGMALRDIIDVSFAMACEDVEMLVEHPDGQQEIYEFDKDYDEELGVEFTSAVFDGIRRCANNCYFCFVDQVAPHMRDSLNVKDDDYRMSFLYGNFITLTNMGERDFQRIQQYHLSPLFVSVQCTNPELRRQILRCPAADRLFHQLDRLEAADVEYHTQIVLCPDLNDGAELDRSIQDIIARQPYALSMAVVPVGLTKFRQDCYPLRCFNKEEAAKVVEQVEKYQVQERQKNGRTFIYLSDEFYLLSGKALPPAEFYDGFPQLDNGIGLARNFIEEFKDARAMAGESTDICTDHCTDNRTEKHSAQATGTYRQPCKLAVVSGTSIAPLLQRLAESLQIQNLEIIMVPAVNHYFGETVNVSGLLTAADMRTALADLPQDIDGVLIPESALRLGDNVFLDDVTLEDFCQAAPYRIETVGGGDDFFAALQDWEHYTGAGHQQAAYMWQSNAAYTKGGETENE